LSPQRIYWMIFWYCFQIFLSQLVTIPVAPTITGMTQHFTSLSDGIAMSITKRTSCLAFNYYVWPIVQNVSICCAPWLHSTVMSSCSHTALAMCEYQLPAVLMPHFFAYRVMYMCADFIMPYDVFILCQDWTSWCYVFKSFFVFFYIFSFCFQFLFSGFFLKQFVLGARSSAATVVPPVSLLMSPNFNHR